MNISKLIHQNEQDHAAAVEWMKNTPDDEKLKLWFVMQQAYDNPYMELMSRFAALKFAEMVESENRDAK